MPFTSLNSARVIVSLIATSTLVLFGCKARELGSNYADAQSMTVDNSWVSSVESCWPALAEKSYSKEAVKHYLADPLHFRAAFAVYAQFSDATLRTIVAAPVSNAPTADTSVLQQANAPLLTRAQALTGVANTTNRMPGPDSLCSIQPGLPVGFK